VLTSSHHPNATQTTQIITAIRHSLSLVKTLPNPLQREAQDAYAASLRTVFVVAACSTLTAYLVRLPVRPPSCVCRGLALTRPRTRSRKKRWRSTTTTGVELPTPSLRRTWVGVRRDEGRSPRGADARAGCYYNDGVSSSARDVWTGSGLGVVRGAVTQCVVWP
jgi:hypothetical protein